MSASPEINLRLPLQEEEVRNLRVGQSVRLSGGIHTARDAAHKYLAGSAPVLPPTLNLTGGVLYHCGPVMVQDTPAGEWRVTAAGPTTSAREEPYMAEVLRRYQIRAIIGKGGMGDKTLEALRECGAVYLSAVGGAAQVLAAAVKRAAINEQALDYVSAVAQCAADTRLATLEAAALDNSTPMHRAALARRPIVVTGNRHTVRGYLDEAEWAKWSLTLLARATGIYNVGSPRATTVGELAALFGTPEFHETGRADFYLPNLAKITADFGLQPQITLEESVRNTLDFYAKSMASHTF